MPVGLIGAVASVGSAVVGAGAAKKAANAQTEAANEQIRVQEETRDIIRNDLSGYRQGGDAGRDALLYELGLGPKPMIGATAPEVVSFSEQVPGQPLALGQQPSITDQMTNALNTGSLAGMAPGMGPGSSRTRYRVGDQVFDDEAQARAYANANTTGGTEYQGFQATPGYQFQVDQGNASINALAGARGGLNSGRTMQDLSKFNQGIANQEYGNYLNRISGVADMGLNAAAMQGTASSNAAAGVSNALGNRGNAQAAGAIGVGNAINAGIGNVLGTLNYQQGINAARPSGTALFGGNSWG